jgi:glutamyl-tRNA synthetase
MEDDHKIEDVINKESRFETQALAEVCLENVKQGEIIQLERRGYFFVDKVASENNSIQLHFVPDGKSKNISVIETKINVKSLSKGDGKDDAQKKEKKEEKKKAKEEKKAKKEENKNRKGSNADKTEKNDEKVEKKPEN